MAAAAEDEKNIERQTIKSRKRPRTHKDRDQKTLVEKDTTRNTHRLIKKPKKTKNKEKDRRAYAASGCNPARKNAYLNFASTTTAELRRVHARAWCIQLSRALPQSPQSKQ